MVINRTALVTWLAITSALVSPPALAEPTQSKRPTGNVSAGNEALPIINIGYEQTTLGNGLTLIVHEDHKLPVVSVATYFHVGSGNETNGKTGFAHLFEHLMFNGSENANDDWFKFMIELGATEMNGTTNNDRTNYFQTVPKAGLDRVLWYESDRMQNLLGAVDQARLDEQRKVVQNEKRQGANNPLGALGDVWYSSTYPSGHPYSWTPIGSMDDLNAASLKDVRDFFHQWYSPNNAVLVLSGDITLAEAKAKVEKFYGDIPAGPNIARKKADTASMVDDTRGQLEAAVATPRFFRGWNVPGWASADTQLLRIAASALSDGEDSILQRRLVRELKLASDISADVEMLELGSQFTVSATANPGVQFSELESAINREIANFLRTGLDQATLDRLKYVRYADYVRGQVSTMGAAQALAEAKLYAGSPDFVTTRQQITRDATPATILAAAQNWLSKGSFTLEVVPIPARTSTGVPVNRVEKPEIGEISALKLPALQKATLSNGVTVLLAERHDVPSVTMATMFDVGNLPERDPAFLGLSTAFTLAPLGTTSRSALEISSRQQELGTGISVAVDSESTRFGMNALKDKLDPSLDLYSDIILNPSFNEEEWKRNFEIFKAAFQDNKKSPGGILSLTYDKVIYGENHPYSYKANPENLGRWSVQQFRDYYRKWIRPDLATMLIVGDTTLEEMLPKLERRFGSWKAAGAKPSKPPLPAFKPASGPRVILADFPGAESSIITAVEAGPARSATNFEVLDVVNTIVGGNFVSRLNLNLREDKGWSYGAKSQVGQGKYMGLIEAGAVVQTDKTALALAEINRELTQLVTTRKPTEMEVQVAKNAMLLGSISNTQDPNDIFGLYRDSYQYQLADDYWDNYVARIEGIDVGQVRDATSQFFRPNEVTWFVVGDLSVIEEDIRKLNLGSVEVYDAEGNKIR